MKQKFTVYAIPENAAAASAFQKRAIPYHENADGAMLIIAYEGREVVDVIGQFSIVNMASGIAGLLKDNKLLQTLIETLQKTMEDRQKAAQEKEAAEETAESAADDPKKKKAGKAVGDA